MNTDVDTILTNLRNLRRDMSSFIDDRASVEQCEAMKQVSAAIQSMLIVRAKTRGSPEVRYGDNCR